MALTVRRVPDELVFALIAAWNASRKDTTIVGTKFHADVTSLPASGVSADFKNPASSPYVDNTAAATDVPTVCAKAELQRAILNAHFADLNALKAKDSTNLALITTTAAPTAVDQASANVVLNACKAAANAHCSQAGVHYNNDGTNAIAAANATDLASSITLSTATKAWIAAHFASAPAGPSIAVVDP